MGFLAEKKILITGLLSNRSIAYGIAKACQREGAALAFTYVNADLKDRVMKLAADFGPSLVLPCDVASDGDIDARSARSRWARGDTRGRGRRGPSTSPRRRHTGHAADTHHAHLARSAAGSASAPA